MAPTTEPIRTPLLRLFVTFYRFLGTPLFAIRWNQPSSLLNLLWNIFLNLLVAYRMHSLDPFQLGTLVGTCDSFKPLFAYFIRFGSQYAYPVVFIVNMVYLVNAGPRLVSLLDADCFRRVYHSERQAKWLFAAAMLLGHLLFVGFLYEKLASDWAAGRVPCRQVLSYICLYVIFNYNYSLFFAVHFYQHGIHSRLRQIAQQITAPTCTLRHEHKALEEIRALAQLSQHFSAVFSLPFVTFTILNGFDGILMGTLLTSCAPNYGMLQHSTCGSIYSAFIILLNRRVVALVDGILNVLKAKNDPQRLTCENQLFRQSDWIRIHEMTCYRRHFHLNIYRLGTIDSAFYLHVILFVLNFTVIFTQTNL